MRDALILTLDGLTPQLAPRVFLAPGAVVAGDVVIGEDSSLWYHVVARGDVGRIRIGQRVNVQDHSMVHMSGGLSETIIGDDVTIGHRAVIHGCAIEERCLVGMGAVVMDNAVIGAESIVGAGALVTPGTRIPPRSLVVGSPARVKRTLDDEDVVKLLASAAHYVQTAARHRQALEQA